MGWNVNWRRHLTRDIAIRRAKDIRRGSLSAEPPPDFWVAALVFLITMVWVNPWYVGIIQVAVVGKMIWSFGATTYIIGKARGLMER